MYYVYTYLLSLLYMQSILAQCNFNVIGITPENDLMHILNESRKKIDKIKEPDMHNIHSIEKNLYKAILIKLRIQISKRD